MFPSETEGLQELSRLSPDALTTLAERYERLAYLCRQRARWIQDRAHGNAITAAEHEHRIRELSERVRRLYRAGLGRNAIIEQLPAWDRRIVAYQYRLASREHQKRLLGKEERKRA